MNLRALTTVALPLAFAATLAAQALPASARPASAQESASAQEDGEEKKSKRDLKREREAAAKKVVRTLDEGLRNKMAPERIAALMEAAEFNHPKVVAAIAKALGDKEPSVIRAALELLGGATDASAVAELKRYAHRARKELAKDPNRMALLIRSVGFHGDEESIDWLLNDAFDSEERIVRQARLFAVARMRSETALESIFTAMSKSDPRRLRSRMRELRVTLIWLTSKDLGEDPEIWSEWWRKDRKEFEVPKAPPNLTGRDERDWMVFWGEERMRTRQKKRGDRG